MLYVVEARVQNQNPWPRVQVPEHWSAYYDVTRQNLTAWGANAHRILIGRPPSPAPIRGEPAPPPPPPRREAPRPPMPPPYRAEPEPEELDVISMRSDSVFDDNFEIDDFTRDWQASTSSSDPFVEEF